MAVLPEELILPSGFHEISFLLFISLMFSLTTQFQCNRDPSIGKYSVHSLMVWFSEFGNYGHKTETTVKISQKDKVSIVWKSFQ